MSDTLARITDVLRDVFEDDALVVTADTTAADVDGWDSLMHVTLMMRLEAAFNVSFRSHEVTGLRNVGELVEMLDRKRA